MGYEGNIVRKKFVDVRIVRSKTGYAILKGCSFYNWTLNRHLRRLSKDVIDEINSINYRMRLISQQSAQRMKRSEKLVKTYDLPPLKPAQETGSGKKSNKNLESNISNQTELKKGNNYIKGLRQDMHSTSPTDGRDYRKMFYSPAPCAEKDFEVDSDENIISLVEEESSMYPHIKVDKCEEKLPPVDKVKNSVPEYAQKRPERSTSSNSLDVPSPALKRRNRDGKCVTILTPSLQSSLSESSIVDAMQQDLDDDSVDKGITSILKPLTIACGKTRSTARSQTSHLTAKRSISRSLSPRLTNRTQATPTLIIKGSNQLN